jgi:hypothetical protein
MSKENGIFQGPVGEWEPSAAEVVLIENLLTSDDVLRKAYGEAYRAGCFVAEFGGPDEEAGMTAVGEMQALHVAGFRLEKDLEPSELSLDECISLGAHPGRGSTRADRVHDGLQRVLDARTQD